MSFLLAAEKKALALLILAASTIFCLGQEAPASPPQPSAAAPAPSSQTTAAAQLPKPSPEVQKLSQLLVGKWEVSEKFEASAFMPKGGTGKGQEEFRPGPGGFSIIADYQSGNKLGKFSGHEVITWDAKNQTYETYWLDSVTPAPLRQSGKWEINDLVFTSTSDFDGKSTYIKQVYSGFKPDSFTFFEESSSNGGPLKRDLTITYRRIKATHRRPKA